MALNVFGGVILVGVGVVGDFFPRVFSFWETKVFGCHCSWIF